jgi:L-threonylcarbamoyladenylate synthase
VSKSETENSRPKSATAEALAQAVAALNRGGVIVFPTETLYGLGADALNAAAVGKIYRLKERDTSSPIPVLVADQEMLLSLVGAIPVVARKLMERFWPGPLTLVLPARKEIPKPLLNAVGGIGVRISSQPIAMRLVKALGRPLTATSANPSGQAPARTVEEARNYFAAKIDVYVDGGTLASKSGSTVAEVVGNKIRIIREGEIGKNSLEHIIGKGVVLE